MRLKEIEMRMAELDMLVKNSNDAEEIDKFTSELNSLKEERQKLMDIEQRKADALAINAGLVSANVIETSNSMEARKAPTLKEVRNSDAYIKAFAEYVKSNDDTECRAMLTELVDDGTVAVPDVVVSTIQTAWDDEPILAEVKKTYLKGVVKIGFEISADGAVEHTEGSAAVTEEELTLGIAKLTPVSIKKWISISDEVLDLAGEAFLQYIYAEIGHKIAKKLADEIVADIVATDATGSSSVPAQAVVTAAPGLTTIATAVANLSDEAYNPVIIMHKLTYADFKAIQAGANYGQDVFDGLKVLFNNSLPAYSAATAGTGCYAIVGDLGRGEMVNFPNGQDITFKFDDKSLMTADLVKVLGRMYAGHAVIAPKTFTKIIKPASA